MNITIHTGRLTKEPEMRRTSTGKAVCSFSLAVRNDFKNADGNYDSVFLDFVAFDVKAEAISKYAHKGDKITIVGKSAPRFYENKEGRKVRVDEIKVYEFEFLEPKKQGAAPVSDFELLEDDNAVLPF